MTRTAEFKIQNRSYRDKIKSFKERAREFEEKISSHEKFIGGDTVQSLQGDNKLLTQSIESAKSEDLEQIQLQLKIAKLEKRINSKRKRLQNKLNVQLSENRNLLQELTTKKDQNEKTRDTLQNATDDLRDTLRDYVPSLKPKKRKSLLTQLRCKECLEYFIEPSMLGCGHVVCAGCPCRYRCGDMRVVAPCLTLAAVARSVAEGGKDRERWLGLVERRKAQQAEFDRNCDAEADDSDSFSSRSSEMRGYIDVSDSDATLEFDILDTDSE